MITSVRPLRTVRVAFVAAFASFASAAGAHDFERTQVTLTFATDGAFVLDVTNDAAWFVHRLVPFSGPFSDRVVLFVDGREIHPESVEYVSAPPNGEQASVSGALGTYRMRGRMPLDARTLRWYYGLPIDPYPLTIRRADGRIIVEEIAGNAWSGSIDLAGQFHAPRVSTTTAAIAIAALPAVPIAFRIASVGGKAVPYER